MIQFMLNGTEKSVPISPEQELGELLKYVHGNFCNEGSLLASVKVDGIEMTEKDQDTLGTMPLSLLMSVEVTTRSPREVAEDSLKTLLPYVEQLAALSRRVVAENGLDTLEFSKLIDGISLFSETIATVKATLRIGYHEKVSLLEADLMSVLQEVLEYKQKDEREHLAQMVSEHLASCLDEWRTVGIPALMRARDN